MPSSAEECRDVDPPAVLDHRVDVAESVPDVFQRIAIQDHQIGDLPDFHRTLSVIHP